jgi:hypothetical protein
MNGAGWLGNSIAQRGWNSLFRGMTGEQCSGKL